MVSKLKSSFIAVLCLSAVCWGQPAVPARDAADNPVVTRSELVTELESVLEKLEVDTEKFATKGELQPLSQLLLQLRDDLDDLGFRVDDVDSEVRGSQQRAEQSDRLGL